MKGILFRPEMIRSIVIGSKVMTRRVIKPQPETDSFDGYSVKSGFYFPAKVDKNGELYPGDLVYGMWSMDGDLGWVARYQPGEVVYIKEAYAHIGNTYHQGDAFAFVRYSDGSVEKRAFTGDPPKQKWWNTGKPVGYMQNPRTMPAWAARYFIKITDVRAERVQGISEEDAIAEGCDKEIMPGIELPSAKRRYSYLWDSINKPPYDWQSNCWVWVYSFKFQPTPPINQSSEGEG